MSTRSGNEQEKWGPSPQEVLLANWETPRKFFSPLLIWDLSFPICPTEAFLTEPPKGPPMSAPEGISWGSFVKIGAHAQAEGVGDTLFQPLITEKLMSTRPSSGGFSHPGPDYIWVSGSFLNSA